MREQQGKPNMLNVLGAEPRRPEEKTDPALPALLEAKDQSDKGRYSYKNKILRMQMRRNPAAFVIDSDDGRGIVGVTHLPTGFRIHMLVNQVDPAVKRIGS